MSKIHGTPNTPVELGTLSVGDWFTLDVYPNLDPNNPGRFPQRVSELSNGETVATVKIRGNEDWWFDDALVHPLTKIGNDWWYKGSEPQTKEMPSTKDIISALTTSVSRLNITVDNALTDLTRRVTALESAKAEPDPSPTPSHLDRLPEALKAAIKRFVRKEGPRRNEAYTDGEAEALARAIWESRDDLFVAGEPVSEYLSSGSVYRSSDKVKKVKVGVPKGSDKGVHIHLTQHTSGVLCARPDALALSRRIAAIAKRGGE